MDKKSTNQNEPKKVGPIIATLVIVLILIIAALYLFASRLNQQAIPTDGSTADGDATDGTQATGIFDSNTSATTSSIQTITNTSDDPQSLSNDLNKATTGLSGQNF